MVQALSRPRRMTRLALQEAIAGYIAISPWLLGLLVFHLGPIVAAFLISFTEWGLLSEPKIIGLENYIKLLTRDPQFWQSVRVTVIYVFFRVPVAAALALMLALLMNQKLWARPIFRTIFYLPAVVPAVAVSMLWLWIFNPEFGVLNYVLSLVGITGPQWIFSPKWALPSLIIMSLWQIGGGMVIYLAGLQGIPPHLYEAAEIDGANEWHKFWTITLPMLSPIILFNIIMNVIHGFMVFTQAYIMTRGGPGFATLFLVLYIYRNGFEWFKMGYASALAWVLFIMILFFTVILLKNSERWVYYEGRGGV